MYVSATMARRELESRRRDPVLCRKVMDYLGFLPDGLPTGNIAFLPRQMATCNGEDQAFARLAQEAGFTPYWPSYLKDKYTTTNPGKVDLVRLRIQSTPIRMAKVKLVHDMDGLDRQHPALGDIVTNRLDDHGQALLLPALHRKLRQVVFGELADQTFDVSNWLECQAYSRGAQPGSNLAAFYYPASLALYLIHAVMFEDYHDGPNAKSLAGFVQRVLDPAHKEVSKALNLEPLMVQLPFQEGYDIYPPDVLPLLQQCQITPKPVRPATDHSSRPYSGWL